MRHIAGKKIGLWSREALLGSVPPAPFEPLTRGISHNLTDGARPASPVRMLRDYFDNLR